jgi:4-alpha-glucanotransferase
MNVPGTVGENWKWRLRARQLNGDSKTFLRKLSRTYSRNKK